MAGRGFAVRFFIFAEFGWFLKLRERGNARERTTSTSNTHANHLRSIPGAFAEFKHKNLFKKRENMKNPQNQRFIIAKLTHSQGFALRLLISGEFWRYLKLGERGNAHERLAHIPNAPRNHLR